MKVILYVLDSLRADHLSCYGYSRQTTEVIDKLADDSILFENCYSPATWTRPVAASLLTGLCPSSHGVRKYRDRLSSTVPRLPSLLADAGYRNVAFSTIGQLSRHFGLDTGFHDFVELFGMPVQRATEEASVSARDWGVGGMGLRHIGLVSPQELHTAFLRWLDTHSDDDFVALIWSLGAHAPYTPPPEYRVFSDGSYVGHIDGDVGSLARAASAADFTRLADLYDDNLFYNDASLGELLSELRRRDLYDDCMLILTGDHGESFGEHGTAGHGHAPFDELIHVPLIVKMPGSQSAGTRVSRLVGTIDVASTVLDVCVGRCAAEAFPGHSLVSLMVQRADVDSRPEYVFSETVIGHGYEVSFCSVRSQDWKLIETRTSWERGRSLVKTVWDFLVRWNGWKRLFTRTAHYRRRLRTTEPVRLYRLSHDPQETTNVASAFPDIAMDLHTEMVKWRERAQRTFCTGQSDLDRQDEKLIRRHLEDLGYL